MAAAAGINIDRVLVADASRRTSKVNAYFTGMGRTQRIVLYDTLLQRFSREELLAVVAHEMGHWRGRHLAAGVALEALGTFAALFLLNFATNRMGLAGDFRIIPLAFLFMLLVTTAAAPPQNAISRAKERQADAAALELTGNPEAVISLQQSLAQANLSVVRPHPLLKFALYTHPPTMERIEHALEFENN